MVHTCGLPGNSIETLLNFLKHLFQSVGVKMLMQGDKGNSSQDSPAAGDTVPMAFHGPLLDLHHHAVPDRKAELTFPVETPSSILGRLNINSQACTWTVYQG